ncbi:MAG: hypothetical protein ACQEXB_23560 [Bacillota bacterium]
MEIKSKRTILLLPNKYGKWRIVPFDSKKTAFNKLGTGSLPLVQTVAWWDRGTGSLSRAQTVAWDNEPILLRKPKRSKEVVRTLLGDLFLYNNEITSAL